MRRILSLLLTIMVVLALSMPVSFADVVTTYQPSQVSILGQDADISVTDVQTSVYGQGTGGAKHFIQPTGNTAQIYNATLFWESNKSVVDQNKYVVFETDFAPIDLNHISLRTISSSSVSSEIRTGWNEGRWNTLRIVYEAPTTDYVNGRTAIYINGNCVQEMRVASNKLVDKNFRVCFNFDRSQVVGVLNNTSLYVKNYSMYFSQTNPGAEGIGIDAVLTNDGFDVYENKIVVPENITVSSLTASDGATIRVYENSSFNTQLTDGDILSLGNIVVVEKDNKLRYYNVEEVGKRSVYDKYNQPTWAVANIDTTKTEIESGYLGKDNADLSTIYTSTSGVSNINFNFSGEHYRYVMAKFNFASHDLTGLNYLQVATSSNVISMSIPKSALKVDEWNNMVVVIDTQESETTAYFNGELTSYGQNVSGQFLTSSGKESFRIRLDGTSPITFAVDDFEMYTSEEFPEIGTKPSLSFCVDNLAFIVENTMVNNIPDDTYNIRVYSKNFSIQRTGTDVVEHGDKIIVENKQNGEFATYTAQVGRISFLTDLNGSSFGSGTAVVAKAGKEDDDTSLKLSGNPYAITQISAYSGYTYYLASVNFIPNNDLVAVTLCSNTQTDIHAHIDTGWNADKWNNITFVYDSVAGTVTSYINGVLSSTVATSIAGNKIGIAFDTGVSDQMLYIDDCFIEAYPAAPIVSPSVVPPVGTVDGGNLNTEDSVKVSDLKVSNAKLTVFEDDTYAIKMSDEELVFGNNIAVYVNDNRNMYSYYNILNNNLKIWGETALTAEYDYNTETITVEGQLKHVGTLQMTLEQNGTVVLNQTISSSNTGLINYTTAPLGAELLNKHYICILRYGDYTKSIDISTVKALDLSETVGTINNVSNADELTAILPTKALELGFEDGSTKDVAYMANIIFAMKPESGFDNDSFINAYEIAEGLAKLDQGSISLNQFFADYEYSLGADYITQYNALSNELKNDLALLFTNQLDPKPTFAELFETAKWFSGYRTSNSAVTTQSLFMEFALENGVSMTEYNKISNDYYEEKVFEKMYAARADISTNAGLAQSFNAAVTATLQEMSLAQQNQQGSQSGGGGGGLPSHAIPTIDSQNTPDIATFMFSDVSKHWAKPYIEKLSEADIINGFEDGTFRPDASITRAEFCKIVAAILNVSIDSANVFIDVPQTSWYYDSVTTLSSLGIITGYDGMFMPERNVSRQDMAVIICRALKLSSDGDLTGIAYSDINDISDYAKKAVAKLTEIGILTGSEGRFNPLNTATRAEASAIISRVLDYLG